MFLPDREGIICDVCSTIYRHDFTYCSYDFRTFRVHDNVMDQITLNQSPEKSFDVCTTCHEKMKGVVLKNYRPSKCLPGRRYLKGINCDLSKTHLTGTYTFKHCNIIEVSVTMSHKPYICINCKKVITDRDKVCPGCSKNEFGKDADVIHNNRALELWVCNDAYQAFVDKANKNKAKMEKDLWTTKPE